jgi:hypothetical protein
MALVSLTATGHRRLKRRSGSAFRRPLAFNLQTCEQAPNAARSPADAVEALELDDLF